MSLKGNLAAGDEGDHEIVPVPVPTLARILPEDEIHHPFRCGCAAIAFAFSGRCSRHFTLFLPFVSCLVDISVLEPIPIPSWAGEAMAGGIRMSPRRRTRVIKPKPDFLGSLGDNKSPTLAGKDSPRIRSWRELGWIAPVVVAAAHKDIQSSTAYFLRIPAKAAVGVWPRSFDAYRARLCSVKKEAYCTGRTFIA